MPKHSRGDVKAFTLIEIMVVAFIIILLAAIAIPNLLRARVSANESSAQVALKAIANALENYAVLNSVYPPNTSNLVGATPPYLNTDYFAGTYNGYNFTSVLANYSYLITATPASASTGKKTFTVSTGAVLQSF